MANRSIKISKITIPVDKISSLSAHERYTYYVLGHVFNEMMTLQKLVGFAIPKHNDSRAPRKSAEFAQLFMIFRLAASKIYEFKNIANGKEVKTSLDKLVFSKEPRLLDELRKFNKSVSGAAWLTRLRNGMGFHYPQFDEWVPYTTPDSGWVDDIVYVGEQTGNTFYDASASVALHWMFDKYRSENVRDSVMPLVDELIDMIKQLVNFLEAVVSTIILTLVPDAAPQPLGKMLAPEHDKVSLPYWTHLAHMRRTKDE
ncbi:hypothetical protein [Massilia sp. Root418]|uniref:hypothetical protein n=1 Tax=Massilia sp. Root418 TaxID=1736532 RepID=UPI000B044C9D|nr:hypothetical protein [Massilia sp. Root418]